MVLDVDVTADTVANVNVSAVIVVAAVAVSAGCHFSKPLIRHLSNPRPSLQAAMKYSCTSRPHSPPTDLAEQD